MPGAEDLVIPKHLALILRGFDAARREARGAPGLLQLHVLDMMKLAATSSIAVGGLPPCPFGSPPAAIQAGYDSHGNLRLECLHSNPQHCWDLNGTRGPC